MTDAKPPVARLDAGQPLAAARDADPARCAGIPERRAQALVQAALAALARALAETEEGVVAVPPLGRFRIRNVKSEREGEKELRRQVHYLPLLQGGRKGRARERPAQTPSA